MARSRSAVAHSGTTPVEQRPKAHARRIGVVDAIEGASTGAPTDRGHGLRRLLLSADVVAVCLAIGLVAATGAGGHRTVLQTLTLLAVAVPAALLLTYGRGLYHVRSRSAEHGVAEETGPVLQMGAIWAWLLLLTFKTTGLVPVTIGEVALCWLVIVVLMLLFRSSARAWARRRSWYPENAIIIGTGDEVSALVRKVLRHPEWRFNVVACIDYSDDAQALRYTAHVPVLSGDADVLRLAEQLDVQRVMVAWSSHPAYTTEERFELVRDLCDRDVHVNLVPSWFEVLGARFELSELEGMPLLSVPPMRLARSSLVLKRALDVLVSVGLLIALAPLLAACAVAIKLDSRGPVFFRQRRVGKDGRPFELLKFRSMVVGADHRKSDVAQLNVHGGGVAAGMFKIPRDPRVTRVGGFLRRTSLDELPQLYNIVRGDMSLVGPRPLIENEDRQVSGHFRRRLTLTPGLTGLWQVNGRSEIPFEQMVSLDYLYVTSWSLWTDVKILIKTLPAVAASRGAY